MKSMLSVCLVACGAATPAAPATPVQATVVAGDAAPLLDAWATAAGGRDRLARIDRIELTGTLEVGGLTGRFTTWETARGERRHEETLGAAGGSIDVFDGVRGWLIDRNHKVRATDGSELADQIALGYLGANAALVPARRPGQVARDGAGIRIEPAGGRPISIAFDPATHLPATIARPSQDRTRSITLADWRMVDGVRVAFLRKDEDGDPRDTRIYRIETAAIDRGAPAAGFGRPHDPPPDYRFAAGGKAVIPVEVTTALVFAQVRVNGSPPLEFFVDTGAEVTVINRSRLARLGLAPVGELAIGAGGGNAAMSYVTGVSFALAGVELRDQTVTAVPLDELELAMHHPIDGILGYDFLSRFVVELDYPKATMTLYDHAVGHRAAGQPIAIELDGSVPELAATVDVAGRRIAGRFLVDTGYNGEVSFNAPFTRAHRLIESSPRVLQGGSRGAGGTSETTTGRIAGFAIGDLQLPSLIAAFQRDAGGALASPEWSGLIGGELLRRFVVTFDYDRKTMWLTKVPGFDRPSTLIGAGVRWAPGPSGFTVEAILAGSPADQAGLAIGDLLISVDGAPAASHTLEQLDALFHRDVVPRAVVVQRGAARIAVTVTPRPLL